MTNITASIQARLKNEAERLGKPFVELLQYYGMERFLYRLSRSDYVDMFILKGGLLLYAWNVPLRRPTRDIDLRGYLDNSEESVREAITNIVTLSVPEDGIEFDPATIFIEQTQADADYEGIRVKFTGYLGRSRIPMQIDIGFSDVLASRAKTMNYPTVLDQPKLLNLKAYPRESIVSEKFHAMVRHADINSRFKDYYDIWLLSENFDFDSQSLQKAIEKTFTKRETEVPTQRPTALSAEFASRNNTLWENFLKKMNLKNDAVVGFSYVVDRLWSFLEYPLEPPVNQTKPNRQWTSDKGWN
jgi:predicted nucleotidyltransferase component of viral defense system